MKQYTKEALSSTLKELAKEKPINKITVTELVEACDIKRQTFYYHFQDIYDLLEWIYRTEAMKAIHSTYSFETWNEALDRILCYIQENKEFCINTYRSLAREYLQTFLNEILYKLLGTVIDEITVEKPIDDHARTFIIMFYSYAFSGILLNWIENDLAQPHTAIAHNIAEIMEGNFQRAIEKEYQ